MRIIPLIVLLACIVFETHAQEEGESRPAPRGLLKRGLGGKGKTPSTTTTTTIAPPEGPEYEDEEYQEEGDPQVSSTEAPSSTEGKKLVGSGVRPFRSNADLLETLKRRRAQVAEAKLHGHPGTVYAPPQEVQALAESAKGNSKKRYNSATRETNNEDSPATSKPSRNRFSRPSSRSFQEPEPEEQNESAPPVRTGRTFSRRGGN